MNNLIQNEKTFSSSKIDESTRLLCPQTTHGAQGYNNLYDIENSENRSNNTNDNDDDDTSSSTSGLKWQIGLFLSILSGLLFTANNFLIQFFKIEALEVLFVRSVVQSFVLGLTTLSLREWDQRHSADFNQPTENYSNKVRLFVVLQALVGAIRLYLNFACLAYLPLGDALTIIFTEPLFTMFFSCFAFRYRLGLCQLGLAFGLFSGMILCVQPPIFFNR